MIRNQIEQDIHLAIKKMCEAQNASDIVIPQVFVELVSSLEECAYESNIAMKLAPLLKRHALEVAANLKAHFPDTYADIEIVQHGILRFQLSTVQMEQAIHYVVEQGAAYGTAQDGKGKKVLVECFSTVPSHPLNITDARAAYTADVIARVYTELGYTVTRSVLLHDMENEIERLGESVARRYLQSMGINVPYDAHLIHADYINELATHIELKDITLTNLQKIEWLKKHIAQSATELIREQMHDTLKNKMLIPINEWKTAVELVEQISADAMIAHLKKNNQVYERGGSMYVRTAQFGDVRDRAIIDRDGNPIDQYAELVLHYHRTVVSKYDRIVLSLPWKEQDRAWFARQLPKLFHTTSTVATVVSGPIRMVAAGEPIRMRNTTVDDIFISDVIDTYGKEIVRWFMIQHTSEEEVDFDVQETSKQISDELKIMKHQRKGIKTHLLAADAVGKVDESFDRIFEIPVERRLLHLLLFFPELLQGMTKHHSIARLYEYLQDLRSAIDQYKKAAHVVENDYVIAYRYVLLQAALLVLQRIYFIIGMKPSKK